MQIERGRLHTHIPSQTPEPQLTRHKHSHEVCAGHSILYSYTPSPKTHITHTHQTHTITQTALSTHLPRPRPACCRPSPRDRHRRRPHSQPRTVCSLTSRGSLGSQPELRVYVRVRGYMGVGGVCACSYSDACMCVRASMTTNTQRDTV